MSPDDRQYLLLGRMVSAMIYDLAKVSSGERGYSQRHITFPGGAVDLVITNSPEVIALFQQAAEETFNVKTVTPPSEVN